MTSQEIDDAIRQWRVKLNKLPAALNVPLERVLERWDWFRQGVYRRIAAGKSTPEIVAEVGPPTRVIATFRVHWTHGYRLGGPGGGRASRWPGDRRKRR